MYPFAEFEKLAGTIGLGRYVMSELNDPDSWSRTLGHRAAFTEILSALEVNWARVQQLAVFPDYLLQEAMRHQKHLDRAIFNVLKRIELGRNEDERRAVWEEYDRLQWLDSVETAERAGIDDFANRDTGIGLSLSTLVHALVIQAWTAFEIAATDIWIAALNARPNKLGAKMAAAKPASDGPPTGPGKQIRVEDLRKYGFDMRTHMGDALADKFNFKNCEGIYETYRKTFENHESIFVPLKQKNLRSLNRVRNLLVHRGGKIDQQFVNQTGLNAGPDAINSDLWLNAKQVLALTDAAFEASKGLFISVCDWLDANPD